MAYSEVPHVRAGEGDPLTPGEVAFRKAWQRPTSLEQPSRYSQWAAQVRAEWAQRINQKRGGGELASSAAPPSSRAA